jgi:hypothetical protein
VALLNGVGCGGGEVRAGERVDLAWLLQHGRRYRWPPLLPSAPPDLGRCAWCCVVELYLALPRALVPAGRGARLVPGTEGATTCGLGFRLHAA